MIFEAFGHSQIHSKLWLCEKLEPYIPKKSYVCIVGSWCNVLGMMMLFRNHEKYFSITGIDIDPLAIEEAEKFSTAWQIEPHCKLKNICVDANEFEFQGYNIVINCSVEHMEKHDWFNKVSESSLVCIQSTNVQLQDEVWKIKNYIPDLKSLQEKYPLRNTIYAGEIDFTYNNISFKRFMIIGNR